MKISDKIWFFTGLFIFSLVLGLLIGASNSPVIGAAISSVLGIAVAIISVLFKPKEKEKDSGISIDIKQIGKTLSLFSISLLVGVVLGVNYRFESSIEGNKKFVWDGMVKPNSTYEAFDWIMVKEILSAKGYSQDQIEELYSLRIAELKDTTREDSYNGYSNGSPYFKMLIGSQSEKKGRVPASE